ncbi:hypothetical protein GCM10022419_121400 [Nonomuraea rosea]|uniref:ESX-1 secretion-associated protein n=1 Tax=Nonomuraea rosea TaxID=638574 RepID=A0ABP6ZPM6_9ACTN
MSTDATSGRYLYVTSTAIEALRGRIDGELKAYLHEIKGLCETTTNVAAPGFGVLGQLAIGINYERVRKWAQEQLGEAESACAGWSDALTHAQANWRAAEEASKVRYVG